MTIGICERKTFAKQGRSIEKGCRYWSYLQPAINLRSLRIYCIHIYYNIRLLHLKERKVRSYMQNHTKENLADPNIKKRFVSYKEASKLFGLGLTKMQEHAKIAGATYKIGNKVLVNIEIFEAYLEQFRVPGDYEGLARKYIN